MTRSFHPGNIYFISDFVKNGKSELEQKMFHHYTTTRAQNVALP